MKKKWNNDDNNENPNYYSTRTDSFRVTLQRTTTENPQSDSDWTTVYSNVELQTNKNSRDTYDDYSSDSHFRNLPKYDSNGNKYYYRVIETYIGPEQDNYKTDKTYTDENGIQYPASNVYYVDYDDSQTDTQTVIDNYLIRKTNYQNFRAEKIWSDNSNQDGKRQPVSVTLKQYIKKTVNGTVQEQVKNTLTVELNETNNWFYEWTNYPRNDEEGNLYYYDVYETPINGYNENSVHSLSTDGFGENSFEKREITNTHTQEVRSLSVDKKWTNETEADKYLRPESIEFILCCQYTAYKYVSEDPVTHVQTDLTTDAEKLAAKNAGTLKFVEDTSKSYDGPVNYDGDSAAELLAYYPDTALNTAYDPNNPDSSRYNYSITLQPSDKRNDSQWKNAVRFDNLPVYINTCGDARWNGKEYAVRYYVKEAQPTLQAGQENPYVYGAADGAAIPHSEAGEGTSPDTALVGSNQKVTAVNELKTRNITVTKRWNDNGYGSSLHYDIDFTLTSTGNASGFEYSKTETLRKDAVDSNGQPIMTVRFMNLPEYDKNGAVLHYTVTETVHGGSGATAVNMHGYEQEITDTTYERGILTGYTITNTLPVIRFKADKVWNDNNNQDGKRPEKLNLTLSGSAAGHTDISVVRYDTSDAHEDDSALWNVDYDVQPMYNSSNVMYSYRVTEEADGTQTLASRSYIRYADADGSPGYTDKNNYFISDTDTDMNVITTETVSGITVKTFHFKNRYTPAKDKLKIVKSWQDTVDGKDFSDWTRPPTVEVSLYCKYNNQTVNLADTSVNDSVKSLFPNGYAFTKTISGNAWTETFSDLPLHVNPTGTEVFNGESYTITYYVEEVPMNGYTTSYSPANGTALNGTAADDVLTVSNTLKTKKFWVKKVWDDNGYNVGQQNSAANHYDVHLNIENTNSGVTYSEGKTIALNNTSSDTVSFTVPQYTAGGDEATYSVTELSSDRKYGYVTSYSSDHDFNAVDLTDNTAQNPIIVTNKLPLTEVTVNKQWEDNDNAYALRPDNIRIKLQRRTVSNNGVPWTSADVGWSDYNASVSGSGSSWSYTFPELPKFDVNNIEYEYRSVETKVNAYDTEYMSAEDTYSSDVVTKQDNDSNSDSTISFSIRNTLIQKQIRLEKVWDDNGCPNASDLHYPVTFTVKKPNGLTDFDFSDTDVRINADTSWQTSRTVPVYDMDGNPIRYTVTEQNTAHHYGYQQKGTTVVTQNGVHSGDSNYYDSYTITNELPLTDVKAVKHWAGNLEMYPNADAVVNVSLKRSLDGTEDSAFNSDSANEKQITYAGGQNDSVTYDKLLIYDFDNNPYTYTITEQTVTGYGTSYDRQSILSTETGVSDRTVTITNTPLKGSADFVKYDLSDLEKHGTDDRFTLKTLPNAEFELYREFEGKADKKLYAVRTSQGTNGSYVIAEQSTAGSTDTFISDSDGVIAVSNLEPNRYYLKEKTAPTGYQLNPSKFFFTVGVNAQNEIEVTYSEKSIENTNGQLLFDGVPLSVNDAVSSLADLTQMVSDSTAGSVHGIPNEENMSHLTLTKVDANNQSIKLPNAEYYLLRLYNYEYRKPEAVGSSREEYLANALDELTEDYSADSHLWYYWEKVGSDYYVTDSNGKINVDGHMFGTYVFYEVKAPVGYERDFTHNATTAATETHTNVIGPVELDTANASHGTEVHSLTHLEPRKKAKIKVLKTDENGNPLRGALFRLYKEGDNTPLAEVTTGYDGLNLTEIVLDSSRYEWNQKFWFIEETAPTGYAADNGLDSNRIEFILTPELADEALHIVRASDIRLKGRINLTKVSASRTTTHNAGDTLSGAVFELYTMNGERLSMYRHATDLTKYRVAYEDDDSSLVAAAGYRYSPTVTEAVTGSDGKLHIEGIEWGDFYLKETAAPEGFSLPAENDRKVMFSVGRNNCGDTPQELVMKNEPAAAMLNIVKQIDQYNEAAWGKPVFIFKIRQTERYDFANDTFVALDSAAQRTVTKMISPTTAVAGGGYADETGAFNIEPGAYTVTEVRVARYSAADASVTIANDSELVTTVSNTEYTASLRVRPNGIAVVMFFNELANYEKFSHTDNINNNFNGCKAIEVEDKYGMTLDTNIGNNLYSVVIPKSELYPAAIRGDGSSEAITGENLSNLVISSTETDIRVTDNGSSITVTGRKEDVAGSIYKLTAVYKGMFTDEFELHFSFAPLFSKTEKTVVFRNDVHNRSHFEDGSEKNGVYTLQFIMEETTFGISTTQIVRKILHNGVPTGRTDSTAFPTLYIDDDFSSQVEFYNWYYSYNDGTEHTGTSDSTGLLEVIRNAPDGSEITVTARLKNKS